MPYIYDNTNSVKIIIKRADGSSTLGTFTINATSDITVKNLSKEYETLSGSYVVDDRGVRVFIEIKFFVRGEVNTIENLWELVNSLSSIDGNLVIAEVWPNYDSTLDSGALNKYTCILDGHHSYKKLHKFINAGSEITIKFKTKSAIHNYNVKDADYSYGGMVQIM